MLFIGICGASGSGKSTLADELATMVNRSILIINQDAYYLNHPDLSFEERCRLNYDEPSIFDHDLLLEDVKKLLAGERVPRKQYDYTNHCRADLPGECMEPHDVIIVEGIMTLYDKSLRDQMDLKIYVDAEPDERLLRVIVRDIAERGHPLEMLISKYRNVLKPMHDEFIEPTKQFADIIIPNGGDNARAIAMMQLYIMSALKEQRLARLERSVAQTLL